MKIGEYLKPYIITDYEHKHSNGKDFVPVEKVKDWFASHDCVEVVRCGDCYWYNETDHNCLDEHGYAREWMPMDYCCYGEKKNEHP